MLLGIDASRAVTEQRTGTEAYALNLIRELIPLVEAADHRLRLYFNQPPPADLFPKSKQIEDVIMPWPRLWTHVRLGHELRSRSPDVFFTPAHVIPIGYGQPCVATVHDLGYHHFPEAHTRRQIAYLRWSTRHNARRSQVVIADSAATKADLVHFYQVEPERIRVIYPGVDPVLKPEKDPDRLAAVTEKYGLRRPYLLAIGTIQPRKNLVRLVQAYNASEVEEQLVLAGKVGWRSEGILQAIRVEQAKNPGRIILPGFIDEADKGALISGATALLFPSLYEGFGFPVLEGNACGTPVLAAATSSIPEIAGGAALLVEPEDVTVLAGGLRRIVADHAFRGELTAAGLLNVARFSWAETAAQVLSTLIEAAGKN